MRKIFLLILTALGILTASAQSFKGFVDLYGGISLNKGVTAATTAEGWNNALTDLRPAVAFGINVSEGYQINKMWFAGIGVGAYTVNDTYKRHYSSANDRYNIYDVFPSFMLPVYLDARWTYNRNQRVKPFVDLKLGYQFNMEFSTGELKTYNDKNLYLKSEAGFYCQPTIGVRFGGSAGFDLGLTYNPTIRQKLCETTVMGPMQTVKTINFGALMLSLGLDF